MTTGSDLGQQALERVAQLWQVDDDRIVPTESGFDWWPSQFRVSVTARKADLPVQGDAWRLTVRTEFLKGVDLEDAERLKNLSLFSSVAPSYGWVFTPAELSRKYGHELDGKVDFWTTAYVREDVAGWLPKFIGGMAILQAIDAHRLSHDIAKMLHGTVV